MKNKSLTIFTPVYNRSDLIGNLYSSLVKQSSCDFVWLIVDDGSEDDIKKTVDSFMEEGIIKIRFYREANQGKHVAHNNAVSLCETEYFTCVDSDDMLVSTAVEEILSFIRLKNDELSKENIAGIVAYRGDSSSNKIGSYPSSPAPASLTELYRERGMTGDTFLIFKTDVIRRYPFPVFRGEKFLTESVSYDRIDRTYRYLILDRVLYLCSYRSDGLTKNLVRLEHASPLGSALSRYEKAQNAAEKRERIRKLASYVYFSRLGGNSAECRERLGIRYPLYFLLSFTGYIRYRYLERKKKAGKSEGTSKAGWNG